MKNGLKILGALALVAGLGVATGDVFANCQEGVGYPIIQCGGRNWFAPVPGGETLQSAQWWQLGYGNAGRTSTNPAASAINGTGFQAPLSTNGCVGNDNGSLTPVDMDLVDAQFVGGPAGALCFSSASNWITTGNDGCADNSHQGGTGATPPNGGTFDDNLLNPLWGSALSTGYFYTNYLLDAPMGVLLKTQKSFALAFFATHPRVACNRVADPACTEDADSGDYDLRFINNGDPGPSGNNIIPWQALPHPRVHATFTNPADTSSPRILAIDWDPIRVIHDGSIRPSPSAGIMNATGVGVLDQCAGGNANCLGRFVLETAPATGATTCGAFTAALTVPLSQTNAILNNIAPDTCVRLSIQIGRQPALTVCNLANAATAKVGDVGFGVSDPNPVVVGGALTSNRVTVVSAVRNKKGQTATITFSTTAEINVSRLDVYGRTLKGQEVLLTSVNAKQGNSGVGANYSVTLGKAAMKGARSVFVVSQPSGTRSNEVNLR